MITAITFSPAPPSLRESGLLGWVSATLKGMRLDGIALRRTRDGRLTLSFPTRRDRHGREHPYVRPVDDETRREIERQVFALLGFETRSQ